LITHAVVAGTVRRWRWMRCWHVRWSTVVALTCLYSGGTQTHARSTACPSSQRTLPMASSSGLTTPRIHRLALQWLGMHREHRRHLPESHTISDRLRYDPATDRQTSSTAINNSLYLLRVTWKCRT